MKQNTEVINLRIDSALKQALDIIATEEERTFAGQVRTALWEWYRASPHYKAQIKLPHEIEEIK